MYVGLIELLCAIGPNLVTLDLFGTRIRGDGLAQYILKFFKLKELYMDDCENLRKAVHNTFSF